MHDSERLSVEELVYNFNSQNQNKTVMVITKGCFMADKYYTIQVRGSQTVIFDPDWNLKLGDYRHSYYCNTISELKEILQYLFNEVLLEDDTTESEDALDQPDTKRYGFID